MGATMTAVWIDGSKVSIAHVGDSRAYLLRVGSLLQLTRIILSSPNKCGAAS